MSKKTKEATKLIEIATEILTAIGFPIQELTPRRSERVAMALLATANIDSLGKINQPKTIDDGIVMKTRDIIDFMNAHFGENISSGSYDDIRRKDLKQLILGSIVMRTNENLARNHSTRGYALNHSAAPLFQSYGTKNWQQEVDKFVETHGSVTDLLDRTRDIVRIPITVQGKTLEFSNGEHNVLQKAIIEEFLPIYGYGAEVLYVGDTADKYLHLAQAKLDELGFFKLDHGELPDVVAYSESKNWLYLIEAVHSSGPISENRLLELKKLTKNCKADIVYVTAFLDRATFRTWVKDIAWETEVWIADNPTHLIHFNGDKFMGPHKEAGK
ncbi:MAG: BsuBI/PstI family type II restriction endonuclease [Candidatus Saccharimonadales bacterium]